MNGVEIPLINTIQAVYEGIGHFVCPLLDEIIIFHYVEELPWERHIRGMLGWQPRLGTSAGGEVAGTESSK